jgi:spermidine synthase
MSASLILEPRSSGPRSKGSYREAWTAPLLLALFFASGVSALVYQVLWQRQLGLVFGVTAYATSTVLAAFMTGLAFGSWFAGRFAARVRRPLLAFGVCEALVGATALATPLWLDAARILYVATSRLVPDSFAALTAVRLVCSLLVLLVPTTMMGATLPLIITALRAHATSGGRVALLYGVNTAGALTGTVVTGFWLIGAVGIGTSYAFAAIINALVALAAIGASWASWTPGFSEPVAATSTSPAHRSHVAMTSIQRMALVVAGLSGFASLALEVIWVRWLVLFLPATTYAFSTMLGVVLAGIAAGSGTAARLMRRPRRWTAWLAAAEAGAGLAAIGSAVLLTRTFSAGWRTSATLQGSIVAIFPAAFMMGLALPIAIRVCASQSSDTAEDPGHVGRLYAVNLLGGIAGALLAGFVLLPMLGSRLSLIAMSAVFLVAAALPWRAWRMGALAGRTLVHSARARESAAVAFGAPAAVVAAFVLLAWLLPDPFGAALQRRYATGEQVSWHEEGVQTTASVHVGPTGERLLYLNGLPQASDGPDVLRTHRLIGLLPLAIHPHPRRTLVVGLGGGATAGSASQHVGTHVDVVELSASVVRGASWFAHVNQNISSNPKVTLRVDDGRNYLLLTDRRYDVITADLIQPEHAGAGNLYSREYFTLARRALDEDGVMLQWIGHRPVTSYKLILRTFLAVFPETTLWADGHLLVGSRRPLRLRREAFEGKLLDTVTRDALTALGLGSFDALRASFVAGPVELRAFAGSGDLLTDDRPLIEFHRTLPPNDPQVRLEGVRGDVNKYVVP